MKKGFTLLEMMTAVAIFTLVIAGVGSAFIGVIRMSKTAMAEAELSVRMRMFREKLLYHVEPPHDGKVFAGLLTADKGVEQGVRVRATGEGFDTMTGGKVVQTIRVSAGTERYRNEGDGTGGNRLDDWLNSSGIAISPGSGGGFDWSVQDDDGFYTVAFEASAAGMTRKERVVIPIFGKEQVKNPENIFHD